MRAFIILATFAIANAAHLGYNYQQGGHQSGGFGNAQGHGSSFGGHSGAVSGISHGSGVGSYTGPSVGSYTGPSVGSYSGPSIGGFSGPASTPHHGSSVGGFSGPHSGSVGHGSVGTHGSSGIASTPHHGSSVGGFSGPQSGSIGHGSVGTHGSSGVADQDYQKEFYSFAAPEHEFDEAIDTEEIISSLKKNLRVVFIKGPENSGLEQAALQLAKSAGEQQTAIYVLSKQADLSELANKLRNENTQSHSKPEVHFVKYRTPEDAEHAKNAIQAQYENLPGSSSSHDGGVAPVHNYASSKQAEPAAPAQASNAYLPPHLRV